MAFLWFLKIVVSERMERRKKFKHFWLSSETNFGGAWWEIRPRGEARPLWIYSSPPAPLLCQAGLSQCKRICKDKMSLAAGSSEQVHLLHLICAILKTDFFKAKEIFGKVYVLCIRPQFLDWQNEGFEFHNLKLPFNS